jgi:hypothetical protein
MNAVERRVGRLEDKLGTTKRRPVIRITIFRVGCEPNLYESTCKRYLTDGILTEIIHWGGRCDQTTDDELDLFVERFLIGPWVPGVASGPRSVRELATDIVP